MVQKIDKEDGQSQGSTSNYSQYVVTTSSKSKWIGLAVFIAVIAIGIFVSN